jgi:hypothetical protein
VNIKIAGKWMFIPLKMALLGIDPYPYLHLFGSIACSSGLGGGLVSAAISSGGVMSIMGSGTKASLMCRAEDPDRLHQHGFEALHTELNNKAREWK